MALAGAGCIGGGYEETRDVELPTAAELAWVRDHSEWAIDVNADAYDHPTQSTVIACGWCPRS